MKNFSSFLKGFQLPKVVSDLRVRLRVSFPKYDRVWGDEKFSLQKEGGKEWGVSFEITALKKFTLNWSYAMKVILLFLKHFYKNVLKREGLLS